MKKDLLKRIVVDKKIMVGKPIIKGTRIPVDAIIHRFADGMSIEEVLNDYPNLEKEDVLAALEYGAGLVSGEKVIPIVSKAK